MSHQDKRGLIHEQDAHRLKEMGACIRKAFEHNIAKEADIWASKETVAAPIKNVLGADESFFKTQDEEETAEIVLKWDKAYAIQHVVLEEQFSESERIEAFEIWALQGSSLQCIYKGTTVGSRRICLLEGRDTS